MENIEAWCLGLEIHISLLCYWTRSSSGRSYKISSVSPLVCPSHFLSINSLLFSDFYMKVEPNRHTKVTEPIFWGTFLPKCTKWGKWDILGPIYPIVCFWFWGKLIRCSNWGKYVKWLICSLLLCFYFLPSVNNRNKSAWEPLNSSRNITHTFSGNPYNSF